ncbi:ABC-type nitrate/sulfonate/bicarbonate transport system, substrate-binding protein [Paracoccus isoporae]|uniref:Thiamine pyrimidine synthase n=1 Tax=Paracoccus isoporae TaxID=591205 RepID=A0A1G7CI79_9RHOB|nr:ABC transporter substrate-binding protein [Paracoccus isoporae]SDE39068.1 ABC-type nitrate/sulfonate/bicarbonate transport system, substrate-binding protein [Paracoccus isoporae]
MKKLLCLLALTASPAAAGESVAVALDWTPNTNHVGLYVAQAKGWFDEAGLDVEILPYTDTSAGALMSSGVAQFGILSSVGFLSQRAAGADLQVVLGVVQHDTGRLVFDGERDDIQRPADLDGMTYAGFGSEWETALIRTMIQSDGGAGEFETVTLGTSAYEALASGAVDFTLEIVTWEGVHADLLGRSQRGFVYADWGVPPQQTTLLGADAGWVAANADAAGAFVKAVQRGYGFALDHPAEAAEILIEQSGGMLTDPDLVHGSMEMLVRDGFLKDPGEPVGHVDADMMARLGQFLFDSGALRGPGGQVLDELPDLTGWVTNAFLAPEAPET